MREIAAKHWMNRYMYMHMMYGSLLVVNVCKTSAHASRKVATSQTQDDSASTSHVLAAVIATTLHKAVSNTLA